MARVILPSLTQIRYSARMRNAGMTCGPQFINTGSRLIMAYQNPSYGKVNSGLNRVRIFVKRSLNDLISPSGL